MAEPHVIQEGSSWIARPRLSDGTRPRVFVGEAKGPRALTKEQATLTYRTMIAQGLLEQLVAARAPKPTAGPTVRELGESWMNGTLLTKHGQVEGLSRYEGSSWKYTVEKRLDVLFKDLGDLRVVDVKTVDVEAALKKIQDSRSPGTLAQYRGSLSKLFHFAMKLERLRPDNPVANAVRATPKRVEPDFTWLYPAEALTLLSSQEVPLVRRVAYALAIYSGLRKGSLLSLTWADFDHEHGTLFIRRTKTGKKLLITLHAGLAWALEGWRRFLGKPPALRRVLDAVDLGWRFAHEGSKDLAAVLLRRDLQRAGIDRRRLFQHDKAERIEPIRFHDCRSTFVVWARREGRPEDWITARTGHVTKAMLDRYDRAARVLTDLQIVPFPSIEGAVPELVDQLEMDRQMDRRPELPPAFVAQSAVSVVDLVGIEPTTSRVRSERLLAEPGILREFLGVRGGKQGASAEAKSLTVHGRSMPEGGDVAALEELQGLGRGAALLAAEWDALEAALVKGDAS